MKESLYRYQLIQDGVVVAAVESNDEALAEREIKHYAMVYEQDGPVKIVKKRKI